MKTKKLTFKQIRDLFFEYFPEFKEERRHGKKQNNFSCDCRCTFVDFIDCLRKNGTITENQADKITLIG